MWSRIEKTYYVIAITYFYIYLYIKEYFKIIKRFIDQPINAESKNFNY